MLEWADKMHALCKYFRDIEEPLHRPQAEGREGIKNGTTMQRV